MLAAKLEQNSNFIRTSPQRNDLNAVLEYLAHHRDADCKAIGKFAKSKPTDIRDLGTRPSDRAREVTPKGQEIETLIIIIMTSTE